jgi:hypothetical protein
MDKNHWCIVEKGLLAHLQKCTLLPIAKEQWKLWDATCPRSRGAQPHVQVGLVCYPEGAHCVKGYYFWWVCRSWDECVCTNSRVKRAQPVGARKPSYHRLSYQIKILEGNYHNVPDDCWRYYIALSPVAYATQLSGSTCKYDFSVKTSTNYYRRKFYEFAQGWVFTPKASISISG